MSIEISLYYIIITLLALFCFIFPFSPALRELWKPKDNTPLKIDSDYTINPFENGERLRKSILSCESNDSNSSGNKEGQDDIIVYDGNITKFPEERYVVPVYVTGSIDVNEKIMFDRLLCEKEIHFHDSVSIMSWGDCRGNSMYFDKPCHLGHSFSCIGKMYIKEKTTFETMFAKAIYFGDKSIEANPIIEHVIKNDIIKQDDVLVKEHCMVIGCIKSDRRVILYSNSVIQGDIFAEGDIIVGENCIIKGNLFSQGKISVGNNSVIGIKDHVRSVIAKKITFSKGNVVYGKVSCKEGDVISQYG